MKNLKFRFTTEQKEVVEATGKLPIPLTTRQVAAAIGFKPHEIQALVRVKALMPLPSCSGFKRRSQSTDPSTRLGEEPQP